jgi:protein SCO1/2
VKVVTVHDVLWAWRISWCALLIASACSRDPAPKQYELNGQILGIDPERREVLIKHQDIKGFMPGMTMPFKVVDAKLLDGKQPGDLVTATLVVGETDAHLATLTTRGHSEPDVPPPPVATSGFELLKDGDEVPNQVFVDENGRQRPFAAWRGHRVALTFMYTRCPMPTFCPLMDRNFAQIQRELTHDSALGDVRLVSVSFDPQVDTPPVLKRHARGLEADPTIWSFVTADRDEVTRFAARFGVTVERAEQNAVDITHNLRTAIIDPQGRVVKLHTGNSWTPAEVLADIKAVAPAH